MSNKERAVSAESGQAVSAVQDKPQGQAVNLDTLPEFRKWKSTQDKKEAELQKQIAEQQVRSERLEQQIENLITDPAQKQKLQQERLQAELDKYKTSDRAQRARRLFADKWKVPESAFELDDTPEVMTGKALDYQAQQIEKLQSGAATSERVAEQERVESEGGNIVSTAPGAPPKLSGDVELEKRIKDLRAIAKGGGSAGQRARVEILKLSTEGLKAVARSAKV